MYLFQQLSPRRSKKSNEPKQQIILVTFDSNLESLITEAFDRINKQYASVYIYKEGQKSETPHQTTRSTLLSKRPIKNINLRVFNSKQEYNSMNRLWIHYSNDQQIRQQMQERYPQIRFNYVGVRQDANSIFLKATKLINLDFIWLGVGGRIGCSIYEFETAIRQFQQFQRHQIMFMVQFLQKLNFQLSPQQNELSSTESENYNQEMTRIYDKCVEQLSQCLDLQQKQINQLICQSYNEHIIVLNLTNHSYCKILNTRNYFKSIWIQEPATKRYKNFKNILKVSPKLNNFYNWISSNIQNFLLLDDYLYQKFQQKIAHEAHFVINTGIIRQEYRTIIESNYKQIFRKFRPDFDQYFISICQILKIRGGCIKEAVGAIIVKNKRILSTGYNGTPIGSINCYNGGCRVCNDSNSINTVVLSCNCIHAEYSCIIEAGIQSTPGCTLYSTQFPCLWCAKVICQARISEVVYLKNSSPVLTYETESRTRDLFKQAKIQVRQFNWLEKRFSRV